MNKLGVAAVVVLVVAAFWTAASAANCNPQELSPCLGAITGGQNPPPACCAKLKTQQPCFCGYVKIPATKPYVQSPNAKKIAGICGVSVPTC